MMQLSRRDHHDPAGTYLVDRRDCDDRCHPLCGAAADSVGRPTLSEVSHHDSGRLSVAAGRLDSL